MKGQISLIIVLKTIWANCIIDSDYRLYYYTVQDFQHGHLNGNFDCRRLQDQYDECWEFRLPCPSSWTQRSIAAHGRDTWRRLVPFLVASNLLVFDDNTIWYNQFDYLISMCQNDIFHLNVFFGFIWLESICRQDKATMKWILEHIRTRVAMGAPQKGMTMSRHPSQPLLQHLGVVDGFGGSFFVGTSFLPNVGWLVGGWTKLWLKSYSYSCQSGLEVYLRGLTYCNWKVVF